MKTATMTESGLSKTDIWFRDTHPRLCLCYMVYSSFGMASVAGDGQEHFVSTVDLYSIHEHSQGRRWLTYCTCLSQINAASLEVGVDKIVACLLACKRSLSSRYVNHYIGDFRWYIA